MKLHYSLPGIMNQKKLKPHLLFLVVSVLIPFLVYLFRKGDGPLADYLNFFILLFIQIELFIFIAGMIFNQPIKKIPVTRFQITLKVMSLFSIFLAGCFFIAMIVNISFLYVEHWIRHTGPDNMLSYFFNIQFMMWFKATAGGLFFATAMFIFIQWQSSLKNELKLREQNLIFQNETLKSQVNPHFLFNSLNTLSSLVGTQPELAEQFIQKLSSIYRYILENGTKDKVTLKVELDFIQDYFFLHKIRDNGKIELEIAVTDPEKNEILPVSLQILVENAIKHNKATIQEPLKISIHSEPGIILVCNNLQKMATIMKSTGIGLKNLSARTKLVSGRDIEVEEKLNTFVVKLPLLS